MSSEGQIHGPKSKLTLLDRSVAVVLAEPNGTASRKDKISSRNERLHRLHGTSLIFEVSELLGLGASTYATACTIFHRFYHLSSITEFDVWSISLAAVMLATKVEEEPQTLQKMIHVFYHIYRKRTLLANFSTRDDERWDWSHPSLCFLNEAKIWSAEQKQQFLQDESMPGKLGPVFEEWHKQALNSEAAVLRQLGFTLYWIPDSHPHKFILYFCQALGLTQSKFTQLAWNYCNDSYRLDLCTRFLPELIAAGSMLLASRDSSVELPMTPPWWEVLVGQGAESDIATVGNAIIGLREMNRVDEPEGWADSMVASNGYVQSLVQGDSGSFTDPSSPGRPGSFLWEHLADTVSRARIKGGHFSE